MKHTSRRLSRDFEFSKVNVILGANGSGKSKFLTEVRDSAKQITDGHQAVYIEGGRTITIKDILQMDHTTVGQFDRYAVAIAHYSNKRSQLLATRVFDALLLLDKKDAFLKAQHSDAVATWQKSGMTGDCPVRPQPPLDRLFELFTEIFPLIELSYDTEGKQLSARKNGAVYGPSSLSDGEKQVFSILADLIELEDTYRLVVVDEPELNLHPELADRVWTLIENTFPDKTFMYATHSIGFALRDNVDLVWVLSSDAANITEFSDLGSLPREEASAFLGGLPGILSANRVVVTEGHEKSFDAIFYRWILQDPHLEIYPAGGCTDVQSVVTKSGLWQKISTRVDLVGVVDGDFRDSTYLDTLRGTTVHVLDLHEAEAYLCFPEVLVAVAERIGSQERPLDQTEIEEEIFEMLAHEKLRIAARRVFSAAHIRLGVSLERKVMESTKTREDFVHKILDAADGELHKASETFSKDELERRFDSETATIDQAIHTRNIGEALRLLPAKELLNKLAPRSGCRNSSDLMRCVRKNFSPKDFPSIKKLEEQIAAKVRGAEVKTVQHTP